MADTAIRYRFPILFATVTQKTGSNPHAIPADSYTRNFGFFCRQELKMQKAHVPLTFRLGSMEYCNLLEQKGIKSIDLY